MGEIYSVEILARVYGDGGAYVEVTPSADNPDWIEIRSGDDERSREWYGKFNFSMPREKALLLAKALTEVANNPHNKTI